MLVLVENDLIWLLGVSIVLILLKFRVIIGVINVFILLVIIMLVLLLCSVCIFWWMVISEFEYVVLMVIDGLWKL